MSTETKPDPAGWRLGYYAPGPIMSMVECNGRLFVATEEQVFELDEDARLLRPVMFAVREET